MAINPLNKLLRRVTVRVKYWSTAAGSEDQHQYHENLPYGKWSGWWWLCVDVRKVTKSVKKRVDSNGPTGKKIVSGHYRGFPRSDPSTGRNGQRRNDLIMDQNLEATSPLSHIPQRSESMEYTRSNQHGIIVVIILFLYRYYSLLPFIFQPTWTSVSFRSFLL